MNATSPPSLDAQIRHLGRVAGIDRSVIFNDWFECPFEVTRAHGPGYAWTATMTVKDPASPVSVRMVGTGETRDHAARLAIDSITKMVSTVAEQQRLATFGTTALQPEAVYSGRPWRALVERVRRFFVRAMIRLRLR